jgi:hypothetical protein
MLKAYADTMNHRIVNIEYLDEVMDVGTLTVDGDHELHDWHTYALSVGVFVKNSIEDLKYFTNKLMRGLGIPSSYLPTGPDDGTAVYNDGKVGTAFIQEYRFNKYCQRLQNSVSPVLDKEFKLFLKQRGITGITADMFELTFQPPQSFSEYRKMALDAERANLYNTVMSGDAVKYLSKRWAMERYLGLTQADILENEHMWKEENEKKVKSRTGTSTVDDDDLKLGSVGVKPGGMLDQMPPDMGPGEGDQFAPDQTAMPDQTPELGGGGAAPGGEPTPTT